MRWLNSFQSVQVMDDAEVTEEDLPSEGGGMLVISQSGETKDVHRALMMACTNDIPVFSVVNAVGSLIARTSTCGVYLNAGRENAVASTKAFTCQVTFLALIAVWFSQIRSSSDRQKRKAVIEALHRLPTNVGMTLRSLHVQCKQIASKLQSIAVAKGEHIFVLGKGAALPIALEGALKIKEISYIHAEGYPGGALKHGPYALIDKGTPIILIVLEGPHASKMKIVAEEVRAREAYILVITNVPNMFKPDEMCDVITVPSNGPLTNILTVLPLQLIAYELALLRKVDPDRPRHLAKAVTVD